MVFATVLHCVYYLVVVVLLWLLVSKIIYVWIQKRRLEAAGVYVVPGNLPLLGHLLQVRKFALTIDERS